MACKSCGTPHNPIVDMNKREKLTMEKIQEFYNSGKYKLVRYNGQNYTSNIGSPTGIIAQDSLHNYGRGKNGDFFLVHTADIAAAPTVFTILAEGSEAQRVAASKLGITLNEVKSVAKKVTQVEVKEETTTVTTQVELAGDEEFANEFEEEPEEEEVVEEVQTTPQPVNDDSAGFKALTREQAIPMADFRDAYGFTHHMQVQAKIKSGELKSYRDEDEGITYVYHYEE